MPEDLPNVPPAAWWRALLVTAYMTGWRISDLLGLKPRTWTSTPARAVTRWEDNKGKHNDRVKLHPVAVDHLRDLAGSFDPNVFPWNHGRKTLDEEFRRVQRAAGIHLPCRGRHEHTPACHAYGFHDLRRAFATENAPNIERRRPAKTHAAQELPDDAGVRQPRPGNWTPRSNGLHVPKGLRDAGRRKRGDA